MMPDFGITATGPSTFSLSGDLDLATVALVDVAMRDAVTDGGSITMHVADVTFVDSSGIGAILRSAAAMQVGCLVLHGVHDQMGRVIDVMDAGRLAPNLHVIMCDSREQDVV
jgi:anti-anti-sigma factor